MMTNEEKRDMFERVAKAEAEVSGALELLTRALGRVVDAGLAANATGVELAKLVHHARKTSILMHQLTARVPK